MTKMHIRLNPMTRTVAASGLAVLLTAALTACSGESGATPVDQAGGGDGGGTATISIAGEPYTVASVRCREVGGSNFHQVLANGEEHDFVQVRFDRIDPYSEYNFDRGSIRYHSEAGLLESRTTDLITGSEKHATGWAEVYKRPYASKDRRGEPLRIEVDIRCD